MGKGMLKKFFFTLVFTLFGTAYYVAVWYILRFYAPVSPTQTAEVGADYFFLLLGLFLLGFFFSYLGANAVVYGKLWGPSRD